MAANPPIRTITRLANVQEVQTARNAFEQNVGSTVYNRDFSAIGEAFKVQSLIGKKNYVYVKCEIDRVVTGLGYGWPEAGETTFYIQDICSAAGSRSGSAIVSWFANPQNYEKPNVRKLALSAAREDLKKTYAKDWYGFHTVGEGSRMERDL